MVVKEEVRPDRPDVDFGLTDHIWNVMEKCWQQSSRERPTSDILIQLLQSNRNATEFGRTPRGRVDGLCFCVVFSVGLTDIQTAADS